MLPDLRFWKSPEWIRTKEESFLDDTDERWKLMLIVEHPSTGGRLQVGESEILGGDEDAAKAKLIERANRMVPRGAL